MYIPVGTPFHGFVESTNLREFEILFNPLVNLVRCEVYRVAQKSFITAFSFKPAKQLFLIFVNPP